MKVRFASDLLEQEEEWGWLDRILTRIEDGVHEWEVDEPEVIENSRWMREARRNHLLLFQTSVKRSAYPGQVHRKRLTISMIAGTNSLQPRPAADYLGQPLRILVENQFSDKEFALTVIHCLAPRLSAFMKEIPKAVEFDGVGGAGELPRLIEELATRFRPLRAVVFADSDIQMLGGSISKSAEAIRTKCMEKNLPCHILKKRSIENYIPDAPLLEWAKSHRMEANFYELAGISRDDVHMKNHFNKGLAESYVNQKFSFTAQNLRSQDGQGELDRLVEMIAQEI